MYIGSLGSLSSASSLLYWDWNFAFYKPSHLVLVLSMWVWGISTLKRVWLEEVCWPRVTRHLGFLRGELCEAEISNWKQQWNNFLNLSQEKDGLKLNFKMWVVSLDALPEERKSQVGLGSVRKGTSSSIYKLCFNFLQIVFNFLPTVFVFNFLLSIFDSEY